MDDKLVAKHMARSEDGSDYTVYEYQQFIDASSYDGEKWIPGMKYLELDDGSRVNHIDDDTFKIVQSGIILKRVK